MNTKEYLLGVDFSMIFSDSKKFVYMKNPKVAGTSIKNTLYSCVEDSDIKKTKYEDQIMWLKLLPNNGLDDYFKFTFVRNPWSRAVSIWNYFVKNRGVPNCTFIEFIEKDYFNFNQSVKNHSISQHILVSYDGTIFVDFIGKIENINCDWYKVSNKINIDAKLGVSNITKHNHYVKYYNDYAKEAIYNKYKTSIDMFGYSFGE